MIAQKKVFKFLNYVKKKKKFEKRKRNLKKKKKYKFIKYIKFNEKLPPKPTIAPNATSL